MKAISMAIYKGSAIAHCRLFASRARAAQKNLCDEVKRNPQRRICIPSPIFRNASPSQRERFGLVRTIRAQRPIRDALP
jgi:hypothetical protein